MDRLDSESSSTDGLSLSQSACTTVVLNDPEIEELMRGITLKANAIGEKQERRNDTQERIEEMWERIREGIKEDCEGHKEIREMISEVQERIDKVQESIFEAQKGIKDVQEGISDVLAAIVGDPEAKDRICRKVAIKKRRDSLMQANPSWDSETHFQSKSEGPDRMATEKTLYTVCFAHIRAAPISSPREVGLNTTVGGKPTKIGEAGEAIEAECARCVTEA